MLTLNIDELQKRLSEALDHVQAGETIEITSFGEVIARVVPVRHEKHDQERVRAALADLDKLAEQISAAWPAGVSALDAVNDVRRDL